MLKQRYQRILVVLLMLLFGGQAIASVGFSCQNNNMSSPQQSSDQMLMSDTMDHSQHMGKIGADSSIDESATLEYCPDCDCSLERCFSSATLPMHQSIYSSSVMSVTSYTNELVDKQLYTSLYRPPISR